MSALWRVGPVGAGVESESHSPRNGQRARARQQGCGGELFFAGDWWVVSGLFFANGCRNIVGG